MLDTKIWIDEIFDSYQGEGFHVGRMSTFIRLSGCPVGCVWCDTGYGRIGSPLKPTQINLLELVGKINHPSVVITGGEPFSNQDVLSRVILGVKEKFNQQENHNPHIAIETSGVIYKPVSDSFKNCWITFSPKDHVLKTKDKDADDWFWENYSELKIVIDTIEGFKHYLDKINWEKPIYVQPNWYTWEDTLKDCKMISKIYPKVKLSLQTHKLINER